MLAIAPVTNCVSCGGGNGRSSEINRGNQRSPENSSVIILPDCLRAYHKPAATNFIQTLHTRAHTCSSLEVSIAASAVSHPAMRSAAQLSASSDVTFWSAAAAKRLIGKSAESFAWSSASPPAWTKSWSDALASGSKTSVSRLPN